MRKSKRLMKFRKFLDNHPLIYLVFLIGLSWLFISVIMACGIIDGLMCMVIDTYDDIREAIIDLRDNIKIQYHKVKRRRKNNVRHNNNRS